MLYSRQATVEIRLVRCSKQPPFNLVPVDGPLRMRDFFATVEFQIWSRADLFDQFTNTVRLPAVDGAAFEYPTATGSVAERHRTANAKQQVFLCGVGRYVV